MKVLDRTNRSVIVKMPTRQYDQVVKHLSFDDPSEYEFQFQKPTKASSLL